MAEIPRYIECKRNPDKVKYETPELEEILNVTYGVMVYQEQVMEIVRNLLDIQWDEVIWLEEPCLKRSIRSWRKNVKTLFME